MNVSLTPYLEQYIHDKVEGGKYNSASEVIRDSLRFMIEEEQRKALRIQELNIELEKGLAQLERGEGIPAEVVFRELTEIIERAKERER